MAHIEKRKQSNGVTRYRVALKAVDRTGQIARTSRTFASRAEAEAWVAHVNGQPGGSKGKGTLAAYLTDWLASLERFEAVRPNTLSGYRGKMQTCIDAIGHVRLLRLEAADVEAWLLSLSDRGLSKSTVSQSKTILSKALKDAVRQKLIPFSPADGARSPRQKARPKPSVLTVDQATAFLAALDDTEDGAFFRLASLTGLRRSEIGGLQFEDVDFDGATLTVRHALIRVSRDAVQHWELAEPKSVSSQRDVPLPPAAVALLRARQLAVKKACLKAGRDWQGGDFVFCDDLGRPLKLDAISARARRVRDRLGLPAEVAAVHGFRHLFGSSLNAADVDIATIQQLLGHSRSSTTIDFYVKPDVDAKAAATSKVADLFGG